MKEVLPPKLRNEPKSLFEEETQMAMAISATLSNPIQEKSDTSLQFTRISDPAEKRRKRPRSYAIVELAPKSCKCEVLTEMHGRFLDNFHVRKTGGESERFKSVCQRRERRTSLQIIHQSRIFDKVYVINYLFIWFSWWENARSQVDVEVIDINQSPTVKSKPPLSVEINHDDTGPSNTVDHPGYFDDYLMDDYCVFLESESDHFRKISSEDILLITYINSFFDSPVITENNKLNKQVCCYINGRNEISSKLNILRHFAKSICIEKFLEPHLKSAVQLNSSASTGINKLPSLSSK
uniref:Uncharacterized protein n=1 Tax=Heterorhabditis bacteriophora TaxID=37862 RepID=A0A1I7W799_HETBA